MADNHNRTEINEKPQKPQSDLQDKSQQSSKSLSKEELDWVTREIRF